MQKRKAILINNPDGFTLIEIIAVLVILGILAAVAVPKYMQMQDQARVKSAMAAIAETKARLSSGYTQYLLQNDGIAPPSDTAVKLICNIVGTSVLPKDGNGTVPMGSDYTVTLKSTGLITVSKVQGTDVSGATSTWTLP